MKYLHETFTLRNGVKIPKIGYGTWQMFDGEKTVELLKKALESGYRHIDTAALYENEASVGKAIRESKIPRKDLFITSKLQSNIKSYDGTLKAFDETMEKLGLDVLDLYLVHAPAPWGESSRHYDDENLDVWKALEKVYHDGRVRAIGVSNFAVRDLKNLMMHSDIIPQVNQIPFYIGKNQDELMAYCKEHNILIEAYSPFGVGRILDHPLIINTAKKYNVSPAQLAVRYCLMHDTLPLPKTKTPKRMIENADVDFTIEIDDMKQLDALDYDVR